MYELQIMAHNILEVADLHLNYGQTRVLHGVSFEVPAASLLAIVGPNGAGKSSTLGAIAGGIPIASGTVRFDGHSIEALAPEAIARLGLSFVPEARHPFSSLTVEENLLIGSLMRRNRAMAASNLERVYGYFPRLRVRSRQPAGKLSGGEQQMLVIGRALMTSPRLMLIDEPSLGLAPKIVEEVYEMLRRIRDEAGVTIVVNEQSSRRVMKFAENILVLRDGRVQLRGTPATIDQGQALHHAYFGVGNFDSIGPRTEA
ncbi:high-affinity branched-chain amino acid ABC transporter ATP-binding protein (plasmid) [Rhizobium etli]|uniref:High-affinity branched-chain amino acid ABC transporter ATP-binding protein n=2 Tax=Rhizobium etli TaxID=29449 RepID=A0AAN1BML5_RHIET|nr:high-affinity branched-chain amino acid ABC transporter ATP-binding protein [Rhizobium etli bv. mimosae str. Mim1]ARQ13807.1 high-affinity branched-chain amino acid ABC transporter ATP-binding protein [Rhizobium etli]